MPPKRKSPSPAESGTDRTDEQQEIAPSELSNEPSTSGTSTVPSEPTTTTTSIDLTATITKAVAEGLIAASEALKVTAEALKVNDKTKKPPTTLGNLFKQDMKTANILPYYPNTFDQEYLINETKYRTYNKNSRPKKKNASQLLYPGRICSVAGNDFPILIDKKPSDGLMAHWKKWLPQFPEPRFKTVNEGIEDENPIVTVFPMQRIPKEKHAVDPDTHYQVLLKSEIPNTGAPFPKHFTQENAEFPCIVKIDQNLGGRGINKAENPEELEDLLKEIKKDFGENVTYVITEFVKNVEETLGCQFYLNKKGEVHWLGTNVNIIKGFAWAGCKVDWDLSEDHRKLVYDSFIKHVAKYLHDKSYFGIVGIDIITRDKKKYYLVDINARITGFTPHALIAPEMAREGLTKSKFMKAERHNCSTEELIKKANDTNNENKGKIIILNSMDVNKKCTKCKAAIVAFGETMEKVEDLFHSLTVEK